jgi:hypothetical protein
VTDGVYDVSPGWPQANKGLLPAFQFSDESGFYIFKAQSGVIPETKKQRPYKSEIHVPELFNRHFQIQVVYELAGHPFIFPPKILSDLFVMFQYFRITGEKSVSLHIRQAATVPPVRAHRFVKAP